MKKLIASALVALALAGGTAVAIDGPAQARDTGWDCKGC